MLSFNLRAQDMAFNETQPPKPENVSQINLVAPTLWKCADGMEGFDSYCIFKSSVDKCLYLIGFDSEGNSNLQVVIESATFNPKLDECTVIQNGTEIRLRERME